MNRMVFRLALAGMVGLGAGGGLAQEHDPEATGTFSIIARDPASGELGMGVQSTAFAADNRAMTIKGGVSFAMAAHQGPGGSTADAADRAELQASRTCGTRPMFGAMPMRSTVCGRRSSS